jgi:hypothetical protein
VNKRFSRFEELAERLVEGSLSRLFAGGLLPQVVATKAARAMEDFAQGDVAPDRYLVHLDPKDCDGLLMAEPALERMLAEHLKALAEQAGLGLYCDPVVEFVPDPEQPRQSVAITAFVTGEGDEYTRAFDPGRLQQALQHQPDGSNYLIVEGGRHLSLTKAVYTLGRRLDCDVVLADARVSRRHAQLRWRSGRYVLFDLGSTGGTAVNGHSVREAVLEPGDVFSLGGVDVIFGIEVSDGEPESSRAPTRPWNGATRGEQDRSPETL